MNYQNSFTSQPNSFDAGPFLLFAAIPIVLIIVNIIFFIKIWLACNDIADLRKANARSYDLNQDLQFWARAKYESDKRLGIITAEDIDKAETYLNANSSK